MYLIGSMTLKDAVTGLMIPARSIGLYMLSLTCSDLLLLPESK